MGSEVLNQPHFDDERTLQSARRVVPLTSVRRRARLRGVLYLSALLVVSGLLGSGAALLSVRLQNRGGEVARVPQAPTATVAAIPNETATQGVSQIATTLDANDIVADKTEPSLASMSPQPLEPRHSSGSTLRRAKKNVTQVDASQATDVAIDSSQPSLTMNDHWEERRVRRVLRRIEGRAIRNNSDLFRIPEIFEGTKPQ